MNCSKCKAPGMCVCSELGTAPIGGATHHSILKQRQQMHKRVAEDAAITAQAEERRREAARAAMHRRQEILRRGEILDAIDAALYAIGGNVGDHRDADTELLRALKEAFE